MATIKAFTDLSQSKKLAEILSLESADNVIVSFGSREGTKTVVMPKETLNIIRTPFDDIRETTMCWSLAALLSVLPDHFYDKTGRMTLGMDKGNTYYNIFYENKNSYIQKGADNPVDACYEMIIKLHELNLL